MKPPPLSLNREHVINGSEKKELKLKLQRISILLRIFMIWHFPHFPIIFLYFFISCQDYLNETAPPTHTHIFYVPVIISLRICQQKEIKLGLVNVTLVPSNEGWKKICNHTIHTEYCCPIHQKKNRKFFLWKGLLDISISFACYYYTNPNPNQRCSKHKSIKHTYRQAV